jgi:hypothetical protein
VVNSDWQSQPDHRLLPFLHRLHQRQTLSNFMPTRQQRSTGRTVDTDEEIPALQSVSSESEDEAVSQPRFTTGQRTAPPRIPPETAELFDSDESDMDITESGTVIPPFDLSVVVADVSRSIPLPPQTCGSPGDYYDNSNNTQTHPHRGPMNLRTMTLAPSLQIFWRPYSFLVPARTKTTEATVGIGAGAGGRTQCQPNR